MIEFCIVQIPWKSDQIHSLLLMVWLHYVNV